MVAGGCSASGRHDDVAGVSAVPRTSGCGLVLMLLVDACEVRVAAGQHPVSRDAALEFLGALSDLCAEVQRVNEALVSGDKSIDKHLRNSHC